jgi:hypothetical protein
MRTTDPRFQPETSDCFRHALQVMSCAYSSRNLTFPLGRLRALLLYKTYEQVESDCGQHSILLKDNAVSFYKGTFQPNTHVSFVTQSEVFSNMLRPHIFTVCVSFHHSTHFTEISE